MNKDEEVPKTTSELVLTKDDTEAFFKRIMELKKIPKWLESLRDNLKIK